MSPSTVDLRDVTRKWALHRLTECANLSRLPAMPAPA
ncbi:hypothetical protein GGD63_002541 [Bradyrhizobium sp. cir1]|nr:hypothetical protein [Bradyrhizobium sp. cir1]